MSKFFIHKRALIEKVYEKAKNDSLERTLSGISKYIDRTLINEYNFGLSYKTFETYYKTLVENRKDCTVKPETLHQLSEYIGYKNYNEFCGKQNISEDSSEGTTILEEILVTLISIKEDITFALTRFTMKQSSWGIIGMMIIGGFFFSKFGNSHEKGNLADDKKSLFSENISKVKISNKGSNIASVKVATQPKEVNEMNPKIIAERKKECMYWKEDHYEPIFCDEKISNTNVIALDEDKLLIRKINSPDTLTIENAMGKVWYDKTNKKVEFFTHYGIHPENGKTLKDVSETIIEKYSK